MTNKPEGVGEAVVSEWRGKEIPIECPYPALGAIGAPSGYDIDPGAGSATDRFQREWPSRYQVGDLHNRDGRVVPLYPASTVTALQEQIAGLEKERDAGKDEGLWRFWSSKARELTAENAALRARAEKAEASGVGVKKLEWEEESPFIWSAEHYSIAHYLGALVLQFELKFEGRLLGIGWHRTKDEAKAAAQADYERRILSALEPSPSAGVNAELLEARQIIDAFVAETVDYMTRNNLGDPEKQHNVKWARTFLARASAEPTPAVTSVEALFPNVDRWGAREWFDRLVTAVAQRDAAVREGNELSVATYNNIASSSASHLARECAVEIRAALSLPQTREAGREMTMPTESRLRRELAARAIRLMGPKSPFWNCTICGAAHMTPLAFRHRPDCLIADERPAAIADEESFQPFHTIQVQNGIMRAALEAIASLNHGTTGQAAQAALDEASRPAGRAALEQGQ